MNIKKIIAFILCLEVFLVPVFFLPFAGANIGGIPGIIFNKIVLIVGLTLIAFFLFLAWGLEQAKLTLRRTPLDYFILGFFILYTLGFAFSRARYFSLFPWVTVLSLVIFYFLITNVIEKKEILLSLIVGSSALTSLIFLGSVFFLRNTIGILNPLGTQTGLTAFVAMGAVLGMTALLKQDAKEENQDVVKLQGVKGTKGKLQIGEGVHALLGSRYFNIAALVLALAVILLINFKVGWIVLVAGALLLISLTIARSEDLGIRAGWIALPVIIALVGLFFLFLRPPAVYNANLPAEVSLSQRVSFDIGWKTSLKNVFGTGPGNFDMAFSQYKPETFGQGILWQLHFRQASNQWAELLTGSGWPGLLGWLLLIILAALLVFLQGHLLAVFLCLLVVSFYLAFSPTWWLLFFTLIAATIKSGETKELSFKKSPYSRSLVSLGFVVGIVLGIFFLSFLGRLYLGDYYFRKSEFGQAMRYNTREPAYYLAQADNYLAQAVQFAREGDQQQLATAVGRAINQAKLAFDLAPNNVGVCERRALIFEQARGMVQGANEWVIKTYKRCVELEPANPAYRQQLGIALDMAGQTDQAIVELAKSVELRPQMSVANYELGRIYFNRENLEQAEKYLRAAIFLTPDYANALYSLGLVYEKQGETDAALALYRRVLGLNPGSPDIQEKISRLERGVWIPPVVEPEGEVDVEEAEAEEAEEGEAGEEE